MGHNAQFAVDAMFMTTNQRSRITGPRVFTTEPLVSFSVNGKTYDAAACAAQSLLSPSLAESGEPTLWRMRRLQGSAVWGRSSLRACSGGSLITLLAKTFFDHRAETRATRRALYVDLLARLIGFSVYMQEAIYRPDAKATDLSQAEVNRMSTLLKVDATERVRTGAQACFELLNRFTLSGGNNVPIDRESTGLYHWRYDKIRGQEGEGRDMLLRVSLAGVATDYDAALNKLAAHVREELHGRGSANSH